MTTHQIIYAWGASPDSVTGQWSANTFYDESAEPYVPLAALAVAYGYIADVVDTTCDLTDAAGYTAFARSMRELVAGIRNAAPSDALAALERERRNARNEAIEAVAAKVAIYMLGRNQVFADRVVASVRAMKEPEE